MAMKIQNKGIFQALVDQLNKLARHNRQGSYRTKDRYYQAMKRFCAYLADEYHLQKLTNISGKHLTSYVLWMQENGKSASTIKTDLSAIRFFHDKMSNPKYRLPDNDKLAVELEQRCFGGTDRTWSNVEFNKMLVPDETPTDRAINQLQFFIYSNREDFQEDANRPLTFHGLRHTYAAEKYMELIQNGISALDAHFEVSRLLGHERADVTDIYLASVGKEHNDEH